RGAPHARPGPRRACDRGSRRAGPPGAAPVHPARTEAAECLQAPTAAPTAVRRVRERVARRQTRAHRSIGARTHCVAAPASRALAVFPHLYSARSSITSRHLQKRPTSEREVRVRQSWLSPLAVTRTAGTKGRG